MQGRALLHVAGASLQVLTISRALCRQSADKGILSACEYGICSIQAISFQLKE